MCIPFKYLSARRYIFSQISDELEHELNYTVTHPFDNQNTSNCAPLSEVQVVSSVSLSGVHFADIRLQISDIICLIICTFLFKVVILQISVLVDLAKAVVTMVTGNATPSSSSCFVCEQLCNW